MEFGIFGGRNFGFVILGSQILGNLEFLEAEILVLGFLKSLTLNLGVSDFEFLNPKPRRLTILTTHKSKLKSKIRLLKQIRIRTQKSKIGTKNKIFDP